MRRYICYAFIFMLLQGFLKLREESRGRDSSDGPFKHGAPCCLVVC